MTKAASRALLAALALLWAAAVCAGIAAVYAHADAPGEPGSAPSAWPEESRIRPEPGRPTLVMLAHPRCPCTRSSLGELERLLARAGDRASAHVVFFLPEAEDPAWAMTDTFDRAAAIPGVRVMTDTSGAEARLFGARTSGHVVLYDAAGRLSFSGGITPLRAHAGDSAGRDAILQRLLLLREPAGPSRTAPVYGCPLAPENAPPAR